MAKVKFRRNITTIEDLCRSCGWCNFDNENTDYVCTNPNFDERDKDWAGDELTAICYSFTCPIAVELNPDEPLDWPVFRRHGYKKEDMEEGYIWQHAPGKYDK